MKIWRIAIVFSAAAAATPAWGDEAKDKCAAWAERAGVNAAVCDCIAEALAADKVLREEYLSLSGEADFEAASPALKAALSSCEPA